jgi:crotonobetainyl-CoA:carnitine CoA-transferase CaiB-like acyl-CoA transferase
MSDPLPLEGLLVLDVATWIAAPAAATVLGDYGAQVIKIEQPGEGDAHRGHTPSPGLPPTDVNYRWHLDSRNKRSLALDLKAPAGRAVLDRLIGRADVFVTNFPLPVRERLRVGWEHVRHTNPGLIYASFTGFGEEGPDKDQPGFDSTAYFARSGILEAIRYDGQPPSFSLPAQGDRASSMGLLSGILLALYERERTGRGRLVSSSLFANGIWSNGMLVQAGLIGASMTPRPPRDTPRSAMSNIYRARDDRWVQVAGANEDKHWPALCEAMERPDLAADPRFATTPQRRANSAVMTALLDEVFATRDSDEWMRRLAKARVPHAPIARSRDVADDVQAVAAKAIVSSDIAEMPRTIAAPFQLSDIAPRRAGPAPALGGDTDGVLADFGYTEAEIAALRATKIVA